jgi:hypothetical protein
VQGRGSDTGDWGTGRVALTPVHISGDAACGDPRGRSDFYLHGGLLKGSSGCIDIGGNFDELAEFLKNHGGSISITVRYDRADTPRVGFTTGLLGAINYRKGFLWSHGPILRLGAEFGAQPARAVVSGEYQAVLRWAGGALSAGLHVDLPMNSEDAFVRAGLRGGAEFRLLRALYGQLNAGAFIESSSAGIESSAAGGRGYELGGGLKYDLGPAELGLLYNVLRSNPALERNQLLVELGFRW